MFSKTFSLSKNYTPEQLRERLNQLNYSGSDYYNFKTLSNGLSFSYNIYKYSGIPINASITAVDNKKVNIELKVDNAIRILLLLALFLYPLIYTVIYFSNIEFKNEIVYKIFPVFYLLAILLFYGFIMSSFSTVHAQIEEKLND